MNEQGIRGGDKNKQGNIRANADLRLVHLLIFLLLCPTPTDMNVQGINLWESGTGRRKIRESASERTFSSSRSNLFSNLWTNCTGQITQKKIDTCWPVWQFKSINIEKDRMLPLDVNPTTVKKYKGTVLDSVGPSSACYRINTRERSERTFSLSLLFFLFILFIMPAQLYVQVNYKGGQMIKMKRNTSEATTLSHHH